MSRRWMMAVALLCPACASSQPAPPEGGKSLVDSPDPPSIATPHPSGDDPEDHPPADPTGPSESSGKEDLDCEALWLIAGHVGCVVAKLVCAAFEELPIGDSKVPCDVAVPIACGLATAASAAAAASCPP